MYTLKEPYQSLFLCLLKERVKFVLLSPSRALPLSLILISSTSDKSISLLRISDTFNIQVVYGVIWLTIFLNG